MVVALACAGMAVAQRTRKRDYQCDVVPSVIAATSARPQSPKVKPELITIAGLNRGHVSGFLRNAQHQGAGVVIVSVWYPNAELLAKSARSNHFVGRAFESRRYKSSKSANFD